VRTEHTAHSLVPCDLQCAQSRSLQQLLHNIARVINCVALTRWQPDTLEGRQSDERGWQKGLEVAAVAQVDGLFSVGKKEGASLCFS